MDKIEKIHQEIERLIRINTTRNGFPAGTLSAVRIEVCEKILSFIDTLSEETDKSLEEAAEDQARSFGYQKEDYEYKELVETFITGAKWQEKHDEETIKTAEDHAFLAGADWQKEQMMKEAVEGVIKYYVDFGGILVAEAQVGSPYHCGDKVKLIVIKED